ncbi:hypothetical protein C475_20797 [Halosimplex carlsbadense 2-9-1]|uniref:Uncharacterized protein n=1 Tax=Halosimplex carlsbadense 2-9-1 TaxID=797114 RepID=M0CAC6_9EURY|nr:hypothetical protein [Halosimplex carlsbadense]ELZ20251.1 hypothetical protein C475_20797 [Halosimplex carlsbadense 2-9-1]
MTPTKFRERLKEADGKVDIEAFYDALRYVREDGRERGRDGRRR